MLWICYLSRHDEKDKSIKISSELLQIYDGCDNRQLFEMVMGDETWISSYEPQGKEKDNVRV